MSDCNHDCSSCSLECGERDPSSLLIPLNKNSSVKKVIAVVSGKGGVGKSLTTAILAINAARQGKKVAILDADITGPSIPKIFGIKELARGSEEEIYPLFTKLGIATISLNNLTDDPTSPVLWRGPVIAGLIRQFWTDVFWGEIDEMYIDMPPGTGDVPLTVFQSIPVNEIVVVTSPQELVSLIVEKAINMANMMNKPILGLVNNMAYIKCPHCDEKIYPFGKVDSTLASKYGISLVDELPIDSALAKAVDEGNLEELDFSYLQKITEAI
ncbi:MAG: Mrp/NBP35 family ATP-binding protein [Bacilli bacterium]|nr:Mrp/NBP35 family ATP-binding protein [Bacilli bacterium]MDY6430911.1 Mrp/NBP35 family ATP-binding protein [Bacilli bacterium]